MGIKYCYVGNVHNKEGQITNCHSCGTGLIERDWHTVLRNKLNSGRCYKCNTIIPGFF
jgi:pyruvate formate lyase activating enzyme